MTEPIAPYGSPPEGFATLEDWEKAETARRSPKPDESPSRARLEEQAEREGKLLRFPKRKPAPAKLPE